MMVILGEYALSGAMLTAVAVVLAAIAYVRTGNEGLMRGVRWGLGLMAGFLSVSSWGLFKALMDDNFKLEYVVRHSERALAAGYKAAAFWAGQEGSLLFWALVLALMGVVMAWRGRRKNDNEQAITLAVMAAVTGFFTCIMLFAGNPFEPAAERATNGQGLNPMLQNLAMVIHPPMLFLGYAGYTAPFAMLLGALISGRKDSGWLAEARGWMVWSWVVLTVGIVLGAQWAYVELGWGGYWAWDPVENASLLPWLTGTALLHSAVLMARRGMFKRWTASLIAASFFLCIFGTYLTRSGVIQSVHSFGESPIGTFFLVFLVVIGLVSTGTILARLRLLRAEHEIEDLFSRDGMFLAGNVLLSVMTAVTLVGTVWPVISGWFSTTPVTISAPFYNKVILPMALVLAAMMATGPVLGHGAGAAGRALGKMTIMVVAGIVTALGTTILPAHSAIRNAQGLAEKFAAAGSAIGSNFSLWAFVAAVIIGAVVSAVIIDVLVTIRAGAIHGKYFAAFQVRTRHWGAQLGHLGLAAIVAGVVGSAVYGEKQDVELKPATANAPAVEGRVGKYALSFRGIDEVRRENHTAIVATVQVRDEEGKTMELKPERRFYDRGTERGESSSEVAIRFGLLSDVYLTLAGWEEKGAGITVGAIINPLVSWIWIGGGLLTLGGLVCLIPTRKNAVVAVETKHPERRAKRVEPVIAIARR